MKNLKRNPRVIMYRGNTETLTTCTQKMDSLPPELHRPGQVSELVVGIHRLITEMHHYIIGIIRQIIGIIIVHPR